MNEDKLTWIPIERHSKLQTLCDFQDFRINNNNTNKIKQKEAGKHKTSKQKSLNGTTMQTINTYRSVKK